MSQSPVEQTMSFGYEAPSNTQFSVFLNNRCGRLMELLAIFEGHEIKLVALSVVDAADHAVVRLMTSRSALARRLLTRHQMPFAETSILVVELDHGRSLLDVCNALLSVELNIHYAYPLMVRPHGNATIALNCDDQVLAQEVLLKKQFTLLGENDLGDNINPGDPFH